MPSGHVLIMSMLSCIINDEHIFLSFGKDLHGQSSCHLYMAFQLLQNMASGNESVECIIHVHWALQFSPRHYIGYSLLHDLNMNCTSIL